MVRLYLYVEGHTEEAYGGAILRPHLAQFGIMVCGPIKAATRKRHGEVRRGGGRHYLPMKNDLMRLLRQEHGPDVRFTTMFDLYGLHRDFPGTEVADKVRHLPYERVKKLEEALVADVGDSRLIPYIQLHEFEASLYCNLAAFEIYYTNCRRQIDALAKDAGPLLETPELIDDGQHSAPSKRIARQFPGYPEDKPDAPVDIATLIDLSVIRAKCPHFNAWLTTLEDLGQSAGA